MAHRVIYVLFLLLPVLQLVCGSLVITTPPSDRAAKVGGNTTLTCIVSGQLEPGELFEWVEVISGDNSSKVIFSETSDGSTPPSDPNKYQIFGRYELNIKGLSWEDGGNYHCRIWQASGEVQFFGAHLYVFEDPAPHNRTMIELNTYPVYCEARFGASPEFIEFGNVPMMILYVAEREYYPSTVLSHDPGQPFVLNGSMNYVAVKEDHNQSFSCKVTVNRPVYELSATVALGIKYGPHDITFNPEQEVYGLGAVITCSALANEKADYQWRAISSPVGGGTFYDGQNLTILDIMANGEEPADNIWQCSSSNSVSHASKELSFVVDPSVSGGSISQACTMLLLIGSSLCTLCNRQT